MPNAYAERTKHQAGSLMALTPATASSLQLLSLLTRSDASANSTVLQARVTEMLSTNLARLSVAGHNIDVAPPKPLPVGTTLTLKAEWTNGQLTLQSQGPINTPPQPSGTPAAAPNTPLGAQNTLGPIANPLKAALANIQTMAVEALMADKTANPQLASQGAPRTSQPAATPQPGQQAPSSASTSVGTNVAHATSLLRTDGPANTKAAQRQAIATELLKAIQNTSLNDPTNSAMRTERFVAQTLEVPYFFPGSMAPLRLEIARDAQTNAFRTNTSAPRSWMVRFATEVSGLGMIHAAISLIDDHVGVQLWAERSDTAERFQQGSAQLRDALIASDVMLDGVHVTEGSPFAEILGTGDD